MYLAAPTQAICPIAACYCNLVILSKRNKLQSVVSHNSLWLPVTSCLSSIKYPPQHFVVENCSMSDKKKNSSKLAVPAEFNRRHYAEDIPENDCAKPTQLPVFR